MTPGRPRKTRVPGSGDKLRCCLEIFGRAWGKNRQAENHVSRDTRWTRCGLPKSVNTVAEDVRCGIPSDRLAGYAAYFGIPIELLADQGRASNDEALLAALFAAREEAVTPQFALWKNLGADFRRQYCADNTDAYMASLLQVLRGVHLLHLLYPPAREIHRGCLQIRGVDGQALNGRGSLFHQGEALPFVAGVSRFGGNLHLTCHFRDSRLLGRLMTEDPLRHFALSRRKPFYLDWLGVGDCLSGPATCAFMQCHTERLEAVKGQNPDELFRQSCLAVRRQAGPVPGDP